MAKDVKTLGGADLDDFNRVVALPAAKNRREAVTHVSLYDYCDAQNITRPSSLTDQTALVQDFLMWAQRLWYAQKASTGFDNLLMSAAGIRARLPFRPYITSPIIVPDRVRLDTPLGMALGTVTGGALTDFYQGDPTAQQKALINPCLPMLMIAPGGAYDDVSLNNNNGVIECSGMVVGKDWTPSAVAVANGGTGYQVGDLIYPPFPHKGGYTQPVFSVASAPGGVVTAVTIVTAGSFGLPLAAMVRYWTAANGYTGGIANGAPGGVFDGSGNFITRTNGAGSGLTITMDWIKDFAGGGSDFRRGSGVQGHYRCGDFMCKGMNGGTSHATYGKSFGWTATGLQMSCGAIDTQGAYYGIDSQITDFHPTKMTPVSAAVPFSMRHSSSADCPAVTLDTWDVNAMMLDNLNNVQLSGKIFHNTTQAALATAEPIQIGSRTASAANTNVNLQLNFQITAMDAMAASAPAMFVDYVRDSRIKIELVNKKRDGTVATFPLNKLVRFGPNLSELVIEASFDDQVVALSDTVVPPGVTLICVNKRGGTLVGKPEGYAKNVLKSPRNPATGAWTQGGSIVLAGGQLGMFDMPHATLVTISSTSQFVRQQVTATSAQEIYAQAILKPGTITGIRIRVGDSTGTNFFRVRLNPATGAITSETQTGGTGVMLQYGVERMEGGFLKLWCIGKGITNPYVYLDNAGVNGNFTLDRMEACVAPAQYPPVLRDPPISTAAVSTAAATIGWCEQDGQEFLVSGTDGASATFTDKIIVAKGRTATISTITDTGAGSPAARTYSQDATTNAIKVAMASGSYTITMREVTPRLLAA